MVKSTCIVFILCFAILFGLEKKRSSLILVILLISAGLFMFTYKSTQFNTTGFLLVLGASFLGGLRWTMAQLIMQRTELGNALFFSRRIFSMSKFIGQVNSSPPWLTVFHDKVERKSLQKEKLQPSICSTGLFGP